MVQEELKLPASGIAELGEPFIDDRGRIIPLSDLPVNDVALIECNKGAIRANHFHKTDFHYSYVLSGRVEYFSRPVGSSEEPDYQVIEAGQLFFTPPMVEHAMRFPVDTIFVNMSHNLHAIVHRFSRPIPGK